ncbi:MAG: GIY-YIG nuclease family protein [Verrucomicrobia bacterium]|nr:GIY-YIG nuclease family protein [Verrucomicrobiota bacterium]
MKFHYIYILQSERDSGRFYVGHTDDLKTRLREHNRGECDYTASFRPWRIKTAIALSDEIQALKLERYLKSPSGRAFAKKRL